MVIDKNLPTSYAHRMAPQSKRGGRPTIFGSRDGGARVAGVITARGSVRFEYARRELAKIAGWEVEQVSDSDVVEFLTLGEKGTREFLKSKAK